MYQLKYNALKVKSRDFYVIWQTIFVSTIFAKNLAKNVHKLKGFFTYVEVCVCVCLCVCVCWLNGMMDKLYLAHMKNVTFFCELQKNPQLITVVVEFYNTVEYINMDFKSN